MYTYQFSKILVGSCTYQKKAKRPFHENVKFVTLYIASIPDG